MNWKNQRLNLLDGRRRWGTGDALVNDIDILYFNMNSFQNWIRALEATCQHRIIIFSSTERSREPKPQYCSSRALSWEWNRSMIIVILHYHKLKFPAAITGHLTRLLAPPPRFSCKYYSIRSNLHGISGGHIIILGSFLFWWAWLRPTTI
jgi:hypothetical protein